MNVIYQERKKGMKSILLYLSLIFSSQLFAQEYQFKKYDLHDNYMTFYDVYKIPSQLVKGAILNPDLDYLSILIEKEKNLSLMIYSRDDFSDLSVKMSVIPELLISEDFSSVYDTKSKNAIKEVLKLWDINVVKKGVIFNDIAKAYIFHGENTSTILLYSQNKQNYLTQIIARGFTEDEFNLLLSGLPSSPIKLKE